MVVKGTCRSCDSHVTRSVSYFISFNSIPHVYIGIGCTCIVQYCIYGTGHKKVPIKQNDRAIEIFHSVSVSVPLYKFPCFLRVFYCVGNLTHVQR